MKNSKLSILTKGIIKENPVLVLVLGTCPTLAVTTQASNAIGMGVAFTLVLICSNVVISLLRNIISDKVRIPCYIVLIAGFVTVVEMVMEAFAYSLYEALGIYLSLIVVNCIILGRAEMFANKNRPFDSFLDAVGMGIGFTLTLLAMASIREIFGSGTWFGMPVPVLAAKNIAIMNQAPGGFFVFPCLIPLVNKISRARPSRKRSSAVPAVLPPPPAAKRAVTVPAPKWERRLRNEFQIPHHHRYERHTGQQLHLRQFLGICPFLGVSKELKNATGMSIAVIFCHASGYAVTWPIQTHLLTPNGMGYLQTVVFILVIAALVQLVETIIKKYMPPLYNALGVYLP
jgi:electron transport complex protein RnfE